MEKLTIKDLKKKIEKLPDDMPIVILDGKDDDEEGGGTYHLEASSAFVEQLVNIEELIEGVETPKTLDAFCFYFENRHLD